MAEGVELPNQVIIRTLGKKETYKYSGILEPDTFKQVEMKEKIKKSISEEPENCVKIKLYCCNFVKRVLLVQLYVTVIPIAIGALGAVTKGLIQGPEDLEIRG